MATKMPLDADPVENSIALFFNFLENGSESQITELYQLLVKVKRNDLNTQTSTAKQPNNLGKSMHHKITKKKGPNSRATRPLNSYMAFRGE